MSERMRPRISTNEKSNDTHEKKVDVKSEEPKESELKKNEEIEEKNVENKETLMKAEKEKEREQMREKYQEEDRYHYKLDTKLPAESQAKCPKFMQFKKMVHEHPEIGEAIEVFRGKNMGEVIDVEKKQISEEFIEFIKRSGRKSPKSTEKLLKLMQKVNRTGEIGEYIQKKQKQKGINQEILDNSCFFETKQNPQVLKASINEKNSDNEESENSAKEGPKEEKSDTMNVESSKGSSREVKHKTDSLKDEMKNPKRRQKIITHAKLEKDKLNQETIEEIQEHKESGTVEPIPNKRVILDIETTGNDANIDAVYQISAYIEDTQNNTVRKGLTVFVRDDKYSMEEIARNIELSRKYKLKLPKNKPDKQINQIIEKVRQSQPFSEYFDVLKLLLSHYTTIGYDFKHHIKPFLERENIEVKYPGIDIQKICRKKVPGNPSLETSFNRIILNKPRGFVELRDEHLASVDSLLDVSLVGSLRKEWKEILEQKQKESEKKIVRYYYVKPHSQWDDVKRLVKDQYGVEKIKEINEVLEFNIQPSMYNRKRISGENAKKVEIKTEYALKLSEKPQTDMEKSHDDKVVVNYFQAQIGKDILESNGYSVEKINLIIESSADSLSSDSMLMLERHHEIFVSEVRKIQPDYNLDKREYFYKIKNDGNLDYHFFENLDNLKMWYFLGLLLTDGSVSENSVSLELHISQESLVIAFAKAINADLNSIKRDYVKNTARLKIYSKKIAGDLEELGCGKAKSTTVEFPTDLIKGKNAKKKLLLLTMGAFDGDGTRFTTDITSGSEKFLIGMKNALNSNNPVRSSDKKLVKGTKRTEGTAYNFAIGAEILREAIDLTDKIEGIPGTNEFPLKRLYKPIGKTGKKNDMELAEKIITSLYNLKTPISIYPLMKICLNTSKKKDIPKMGRILKGLIEEGIVVQELKKNIKSKKGESEVLSQFSGEDKILITETSKYQYKINPIHIIEIYPEEIRDYEETRMFITKEECEKIIDELGEKKSREETIQWISEEIDTDFKHVVDKIFFLEKEKFHSLQNLYGKPITHTEILSVFKLENQNFDEEYFHEFAEADIEKAKEMGIFFAAGNISAPGNGYECYGHFIEMNEHTNKEIMREFLSKTKANMNNIDLEHGFSLRCKNMTQDLIKHGFSADAFKFSKYPQKALNPAGKHLNKLEYAFLAGYYRVKGFAGVITDKNKKMLNKFSRRLKIGKYTNVIFIRKENCQDSYYSIRIPDNILEEIGVDKEKEKEKIFDCAINPVEFEEMQSEIQCDTQTLSFVLKSLVEYKDLKKINLINKPNTCAYQCVPEPKYIKPHTEEAEWKEKFEDLTDEYIIEWIWEKSVLSLANKFGISSNSASYRIKKRGIVGPPPGFHNMSIENQKEIRDYFFLITECLWKEDESLSIEEISDKSGVPLDFLDEWMDCPALHKVIERNYLEEYCLRETKRVSRIDEKRKENDEIALNKILDKMREIGGSVAVYTLERIDKVGMTGITIKRVLNLGVSKGLIKIVKNKNKVRFELI